MSTFYPKRRGFLTTADGGFRDNRSDRRKLAARDPSETCVARIFAVQIDH
jgi:hypothetical protein